MLTELAVLGGRVFIASSQCSSDYLAKQAASICFGGAVENWDVDRTLGGAPRLHERNGRIHSVSLSAAGAHRGVLVAHSEDSGIDLETIDRIRLNTGGDDDWLRDDERLLLRSLPLNKQVLELACRWMLRESYGKATGLGLAAPRHPRMQPHGARADWTFGLYRFGELLFSTVYSGLPNAGFRYRCQAVANDLKAGEPVFSENLEQRQYNGQVIAGF